MEKHLFHLKSVWTGKNDGDGVIQADAGTIEYGVPAEMGGKLGRTNPEEMLVASVASCYSITLAVVAERRRLPVTKIEVSCEGEMVRQPDKTLKFTAIRLVPRITVEGADEKQIASVLDAAQRAEQYCPISQALHGNVEITIMPEIVS